MRPLRLYFYCGLLVRVQDGLGFTPPDLLREWTGEKELEVRFVGVYLVIHELAVRSVGPFFPVQLTTRLSVHRALRYIKV